MKRAKSKRCNTFTEWAEHVRAPYSPSDIEAFDFERPEYKTTVWGFGTSGRGAELHLFLERSRKAAKDKVNKVFKDTKLIQVRHKPSGNEVVGVVIKLDHPLSLKEPSGINLFKVVTNYKSKSNPQPS